MSILARPGCGARRCVGPTRARGRLAGDRLSEWWGAEETGRFGNSSRISVRLLPIVTTPHAGRAAGAKLFVALSNQQGLQLLQAGNGSIYAAGAKPLSRICRNGPLSFEKATR